MVQANPDYGKGVFRRRLRIEAKARRVDVALEDGNHGFRLTLHHDGQRVVDIVADAPRYPFATCPEAAQVLKRIVGCPLDEDITQMRRRLVPGDNCTHLLDMALLAVAYASKSGLTRQYDITIVDEQNGITLAQIDCNGERLHEWSIRDHVVEAPVSLAGGPMMKGFHPWASEMFSGQALEAAMVLHRGYFVAQSRRYLFDGYSGVTDGRPSDTCYSYNPKVVERALRINGSLRDFSLSPEKLLKFEP